MALYTCLNGLSRVSVRFLLGNFYLKFVIGRCVCVSVTRWFQLVLESCLDTSEGSDESFLASWHSNSPFNRCSFSLIPEVKIGLSHQFVGLLSWPPTDGFDFFGYETGSLVAELVSGGTWRDSISSWVLVCLLSLVVRSSDDGSTDHIRNSVWFVRVRILDK